MIQSIYVRKCTPDRLRELAGPRRLATLTCFLRQSYRDTIDQAVDMFDKITIRMQADTALLLRPQVLKQLPVSDCPVARAIASEAGLFKEWRLHLWLTGWPRRIRVDEPQTAGCLSRLSNSRSKPFPRCF